MIVFEEKTTSSLSLLLLLCKIDEIEEKKEDHLYFQMIIDQ